MTKVCLSNWDWQTTPAVGLAGVSHIRLDDNSSSNATLALAGLLWGGQAAGPRRLSRPYNPWSDISHPTESGTCTAWQGNPRPRCGVHCGDMQWLLVANCCWHALAQRVSPSPHWAGAIGLHWHRAMPKACPPTLEGVPPWLRLPAGSRAPWPAWATSGAAWLAHNPSMQEQGTAYGFTPAKFWQCWLMSGHKLKSTSVSLPRGISHF